MDVVSVNSRAVSFGSVDEVAFVSAWPKKMLLPVRIVSSATGTVAINLPSTCYMAHFQVPTIKPA